MTEEVNTSVGEKNGATIFIAIVSILIPLVVALLLFVPSKFAIDASWIKILPKFNAVINSLTAICLIIGFILIKKGNQSMHRLVMLAAFIFGCIFLVSYVMYHSSTQPVKYGDLNGDGILSAIEVSEVGSIRYLYYIILFSHIILAGIVVPLVLMALYFAITNNFVKHKNIVRFTFPIWLYVSVTGVVVFLMLNPYYQ